MHAAIFADLPPKSRSGNTKNFKVLLRWKGSLWDHVWIELLAYTLAYFIVALIYRFGLTGSYQENFTQSIKFVQKQEAGLPLTFILGFYVNLVVNRWWNLYNALPFPDDLALILRNIIPNEDKKDALDKEDDTQDDLEEPRKMRRTILRYSLLSYILALRPHSLSIQTKFPTQDSMVTAGLATKEELEEIDEEIGGIGEEDKPKMYTSNWWVPFQWSIERVAREVERGTIDMSRGHHHILGKITSFKQSLQQAKTYYNISVPLVYSQVVSVAVYLYFVVALVGEQWRIDEELDLWYPIFLSLRFLFIIGWLDTAQALSDPFGVDVEDFKLDKLIDRHLQVSMAIVDQTQKHPEVRGDDRVEEILESGVVGGITRKGTVGASAAWTTLRDKERKEDAKTEDDEANNDSGDDGGGNDDAGI